MGLTHLGEKLSKKKILLVGHITESYGPMQSLPKYLAKNFNEFAVVTHPFSYSKIPRSNCFLYKNGRISQKINGPDYKTIQIIHFFGDVILDFYFLIKLRKRFEIFIGSNCLNGFVGLVLKFLGIVDKVIFYEETYTPKRFENKALDNFFHWLNGLVARWSDIIWDNAPNIEWLRKKQRVDLEKIIRVPHGVDLEKIKINPIKKNNLSALVYVGHITESKGLQLLVEAVGEIIKIKPQVRVAIIGSGPYESELKRLVKDNNLNKFFKFFGYTTHDWSLSFLPTCGIALAPYANEEKGTFRYAEPLKVKDYLACGLPVIITKVPSIAKEIEEKKLGLAINYDLKELKKAILKLLNDENFYQLCRKNILNYAKNITWDYTYNQAFNKTLKIAKI